MDSLEQDPLLNLNKAMSLFLYGFLTGFGFSTGCTHGHSHKIITLPLKKKLVYMHNLTDISVIFNF